MPLYVAAVCCVQLDLYVALTLSIHDGFDNLSIIGSNIPERQEHETFACPIANCQCLLPLGVHDHEHDYLVGPG
jgi:hypothetical protein